LGGVKGKPANYTNDMAKLDGRPWGALGKKIIPLEYTSVTASCISGKRREGLPREGEAEIGRAEGRPARRENRKMARNKAQSGTLKNGAARMCKKGCGRESVRTKGIIE